MKTFAAMSLLYVLFAKFVPIISVWELKVGMHEAHPVAAEDADEAQELWRAQP